MGIYDGILLCTDFDGTLAEHAAISHGNAEAIRYFQREGGRFTIASGRSPEFLWTMRDILTPNAPLISVNGTMINDENDMRILRSFPLEDGALEDLCALAEITQTDTLIVYAEQSDSSRWTRADAQSVREAFENVPRPWYKALLVQETSKTEGVMRAAREQMGDRYTFDQSWPMGIEMHMRGSGKGECLPVLKELLGGEIRLTVGVGDYENDISLITLSDIGYAVGNATESVKRIADRITVPNTQDAIARVIEDLARK